MEELQIILLVAPCQWLHYCISLYTTVYHVKIELDTSTRMTVKVYFYIAIKKLS